MPSAPHLRFTADDARVEAVVLILHGGRPDSFMPVRAFDPSVVRMFPFGRSLVQAGGGRLALARLRYAVRGWNGPQESPLADARWALDRIAERFGNLPIGLVGHSMGGRVSLRVFDHVTPQGVGVRSVAALAPWLPPGELIPPLNGRTLLLAHGTADRMTDPKQSAELAYRLTAEGGDVEFVKYPGARHHMLFPHAPWHDLVDEFMVRTLLGPMPGGPAAPQQP